MRPNVNARDAEVIEVELLSQVGHALDVHVDPAERPSPRTSMDIAWPRLSFAISRRLPVFKTPLRPFKPRHWP